MMPLRSVVTMTKCSSSLQKLWFCVLPRGEGLTVSVAKTELPSEMRPEVAMSSQSGKRTTCPTLPSCFSKIVSEIFRKVHIVGGGKLHGRPLWGGIGLEKRIVEEGFLERVFRSRCLRLSEGNSKKGLTRVPASFHGHA